MADTSPARVSVATPDVAVGCPFDPDLRPDSIMVVDESVGAVARLVELGVTLPVLQMVAAVLRVTDEFPARGGVLTRELGHDLRRSHDWRTGARGHA
ncbi:MAG: hypothetical protein ACRDRK_07860 [Pseudonocardia sp.]